MQLDEAVANLESLQKTKESTVEKWKYYSSRQYLNQGEKEYFTSLKVGIGLQTAQTIAQGSASIAYNTPDVAVGPFASVSHGGTHIGNMLSVASAAIGVAAAINTTAGVMASTKGSFDRRMDEWMFQARTAEIELKQLEKQILGAEIRVQIAQKEYDNQGLQIEQSRDMDTFMRSKYTNKELYDWMVGQISSTYFQSYQLAIKLAQRAEICYGRELPEKASSGKPKFIQSSYWDSLKKGLLAGENLQFDLRNMEASYINENARTLELTKHISLAMLNPMSLIDLISKGSCNFSIPEELYDLDYPDHYNRIIKSISISIPCVAGPYTTVPCTLTHTGSYVRKAADSLQSVTAVPCNTIATSSAQNDNGVFDFNFRDERYLPFEGAGAICNMDLQLGGLKGSDGNVNLFPFDFNTISDVIIHVKYTAQKATGTGANRSETVHAKINAAILGTYPFLSTTPTVGATGGILLPRMLSLKHEFPNEWFKYSDHYGADSSTPVTVKLMPDHFPFYKKGRGITVVRMDMKIVKKAASSTAYRIKYRVGTGTEYSVDISGTTSLGTASSLSISIPNTPPGQNISFRMTTATDTPVNIDDLLEDVLIVATYQVVG